MVRIIEEVLDLCRAGQGKLSLRKERVDLAAVVAGAIETAGTFLATRGHHLTVSLPPGPVSLDWRDPEGWVEAPMADRCALGAPTRGRRSSGTPPADPTPRLDPILFGPDPTARGDAWRERGQWERAEAAYLEALRARPLNESARDALVRLHLERGHFDRAKSFARMIAWLNSTAERSSSTRRPTRPPLRRLRNRAKLRE